MIAEFAEAVIAIDPTTGAGIVWSKKERTCPTCGRAAMQLTVHDGRTTCPNCAQPVWLRIYPLSWCAKSTEVPVDCTLPEFLADNAEGLDAETLERVRGLGLRQSLILGGGAAPAFEVVRVK